MMPFRFVVIFLPLVAGSAGRGKRIQIRSLRNNKDQKTTANNTTGEINFFIPLQTLASSLPHQKVRPLPVFGLIRELPAPRRTPLIAKALGEPLPVSGSQRMFPVPRVRTPVAKEGADFETSFNNDNTFWKGVSQFTYCFLSCLSIPGLRNLQKGCDQDLNKSTFLPWARNLQVGETLTPPDLYKRQWIDAPPGRGTVPTSGVPVRVAQFNILADGLSAMDENKGGFTGSPVGSLEWRYRRARLVYELVRHGDLPDIVAMQEVDHYYDWFAPVLAWLGYEGSFVAKPNSKSKRSLDPSLEDGCALFWRTGTVTLIEQETMNFDKFDQDGAPTGKKSNQVAILATLQRLGAEPMVVGVSHLKASKRVAGERVRANQAMQLLDRVSKKGLPCIVAIDLNGAPERNPTADYPPEAYPSVMKHMLGLHSVYKDVLGQEPKYTTWKQRAGRPMAKHTIDYIFASPTIGVSRVLSLPEEDDIAKEGLPCWNYPSDHFALMAELRVRPKQ